MPHATLRRLLTLGTIMLLNACAILHPAKDLTTNEDLGKALVTNTAYHEIFVKALSNPNLRPAYIYEIDGKHVPYVQDGFYLTPGKHTFKVWPVLDQPVSMIMVPDLAYIGLHNIRVEEITIDVKADHRYFIGLETLNFRTVGTLGEVSYPSDWQPVFVPKVVKVIPPIDMKQAAQGFGAFFGALLIGPLLLIGM